MTEKRLLDGFIATDFSSILADHTLQAATKKAPAKKVPAKKLTTREPRVCGETVQGITCPAPCKPPKKKAYAGAVQGWALPSVGSQPHA